MAMSRRDLFAAWFVFLISAAGSLTLAGALWWKHSGTLALSGVSFCFLVAAAAVSFRSCFHAQKRRARKGGKLSNVMWSALLLCAIGVGVGFFAVLPVLPILKG